MAKKVASKDAERAFHWVLLDDDGDTVEHTFNCTQGEAISRFKANMNDEFTYTLGKVVPVATLQVPQCPDPIVTPL
jgi:hypothetical protein